MASRLEIGGTLGRIIGVIVGVIESAIGVVVIFIGYYWAERLQMWQMWLVILVGAAFVLFGLHTVIAALTEDNYEATFGSGRAG